jgi:uncharacterized protein (TIGR00255 family)
VDGTTKKRSRPSRGAAAPISMTGFGSAHLEGKGFAVEVEARSVNHRFVAFNLRMPMELGLAEPEVEERIRKQIQRGSVTLTVQLRRLAAPPPTAVVDVAQARAVLAALRKLSKDLKLPAKITFDQVARAPGVLVSRAASNAPDPAIQALALRGVDQAMSQLVASRKREGRALAADLRARIAMMREAAARLEARAPRAVVEVFARMRKRVEELLGEHRGALANGDLAREMALLAERTDIAEEIARLRTHLDELDSLLSRGEPVGRRVDFLVQELLREVNTTGSKSNDAEITKIVIDLKAEVERIREQGANLE